MASVRKLRKDDPKSPWIVEYTDQSGKRRRKTPKSGLKKDADKLRVQIENEIESGSHTASSESMRIRDVADLFIKHLEGLVITKAIGRGRLVDIKAVLLKCVVPRLGAKKICELTADDVADFIRYQIEDQKLQGVTVKNRMVTFRKMEGWAARRGYTKRCVVPEGIKEYPIRNVQEIAVPSKDDLNRLLQAVENDAAKNGARCHRRSNKLVRIAVHLAAFCGLRFGETQGLCLHDVDLTKRVLKVRRSMSRFDGLKGPKTSAGVRDVPLPPHIVEMLTEWIAVYHVKNDTGLLLTTSVGTSVSAAGFHRSYWRPLLQRAGLDGDGDEERIHFHALRHFAASWWIENGLPIPVVSKLLGHANSNITMKVYAHALHDATDRMDALDAMATALLAHGCDKNATSGAKSLILQG